MYGFQASFLGFDKHISRKLQTVPTIKPKITNQREYTKKFWDAIAGVVPSKFTSLFTVPFHTLRTDAISYMMENNNGHKNTGIIGVSHNLFLPNKNPITIARNGAR